MHWQQKPNFSGKTKWNNENRKRITSKQPFAKRNEKQEVSHRKPASKSLRCSHCMHMTKNKCRPFEYGEMIAHHLWKWLFFVFCIWLKFERLTSPSSVHKTCKLAVSSWGIASVHGNFWCGLVWYDLVYFICQKNQ